MDIHNGGSLGQTSLAEQLDRWEANLPLIEAHPYPVVMF